MLLQSRVTVTEPDRDRLWEMLWRNGTSVCRMLCADDLQRELGRAQVVDPAAVPEDVVTMHSTVRLRDMDSDRVEFLTLAYPAESDLSAGRLSVLSPLGTALLGTRVGDIVRVVGAAGPRALLVEEVVYQPEAAGAAD